MRRRRPDEADRPEPAELAALADGSLASPRRATLEAQVAADPELAGLLAEQQRALGLAQAALADSEAPAALRARVAAQRRPADRAPMRGLLAMGVAVTAVLILGIVLTVTSGTSAEHLQAALAATPLSPGAGGEASFTKTASGWRIQLDASGLPRRDDPLFYQAW